MESTAPNAEVSQAAPASLPEAPASTPDKASVALESVDDIAAALKKAQVQPAESATEEAPPEEGESVEGQEPVEREPAKPQEPAAAAAPASWGKEAQVVFAKLPPELQAEVTKRETERESFVNRKSQEAAQSRQEAKALYQYATSELREAVAQAEAAVLAEFGNIDLTALKQQDPATYLKIEGMFEMRQASIQKAREHLRTLEEAGQAKYQREMDTHLGHAATEAKEKVSAVMGDGFSPAVWKGQAAQYLADVGAPMEHIHGLTHAYQLEIVAKAMKYDELRKSAETAKSKVAAAPKVMAPKGGAPANGESEAKRKAFEDFRKNPSDNDAIAAYLKYV